MSDAPESAPAAQGPRLHLDAELSLGAEISLSREASNYLFAVRLLSEGDGLCIFNGRDGEWRAAVVAANKQTGRILVVEQLRTVAAPPDLWLLFAPIKKARTDFIVEKATELGCRRIMPVSTRRTQSDRVNVDRLQAHAVEAAEQCELVFVPEVSAPARFADVLNGWDAGRRLYFCDEARDARPLAEVAAEHGEGPAAIIIGPEGGFTPEERERLKGLPYVTAASLGPRVLRADTAVAAAIAVWQTACGDW